MDATSRDSLHGQFGAALDILENAIRACSRVCSTIAMYPERARKCVRPVLLRLDRHTRVEALLYNMRHVQHHAAQLNLLLRQATNSAPDWVARTALDF